MFSGWSGRRGCCGLVGGPAGWRNTRGRDFAADTFYLF
jgi:hypothetical protein